MKFKDIREETIERPEDVLWRSSNRRPENAYLGMSFGGWSGSSLERQTETSLGWSNKIFRRRSEDAGGGPSDALGDNICRLG